MAEVTWNAKDPSYVQQLLNTESIDITTCHDEPVGFCSSCQKLQYPAELEPDGVGCYCESCGENTLDSVLVILGLI